MKKQLKVFIIIIIIVLGVSALSFKLYKDNKEPVKETVKETENFKSIDKENNPKENKVPFNGILYIGHDDGFKEVPFTLENGLDTEGILKALSNETNWNLKVSDIQLSDKGSIKICWSKSSSLYTGIPEEQKMEFFVAKQEDLDAMILDSVKKTILENEKKKNIYYSDEKGNTLKLPNTYVEIPIDKPYSNFNDYMEYEPIY